MERTKEFLDSLTVTTAAGKEGVLRTAFKSFSFANHGIDVSHIKNGALGTVTNRRHRHTAKMLGFCDLNNQTTDLGRYLCSQKDESNEREIIQNQFCKWLFPRRENGFNTDVPDDFGIYPYWATLEFLLKFDGEITELEFTVFLTTLRNRVNIDKHVNELNYIRAENIDLLEINLPQGTVDKFNKGMWANIFENSYFPYIMHYDGKIKLTDKVNKDFLAEKITYFYGHCQFTNADSEDYQLFLQDIDNKHEYSLSYDNSQTDIKKIIDEKIRTTIKSRRGQTQFREALLKDFNRTCCITGSQVISVLEAAHIKPHSSKTDYNKNNGLLLRSDVHTLFDQGLLVISKDGIIYLDDCLNMSEYYKYHGIKLPDDIFVNRRGNILARISLN